MFVFTISGATLRMVGVKVGLRSKTPSAMEQTLKQTTGFAMGLAIVPEAMHN
jgi:hypothetical protein